MRSQVKKPIRQRQPEGPHESVPPKRDIPMETGSTSHPSAESLRALALGKLDDISASAVLSHLDGCNDCRKEVAAVTNDGFLNRLRQAHERDSSPALTSTAGRH